MIVLGCGVSMVVVMVAFALYVRIARAFLPLHTHRLVVKFQLHHIIDLKKKTHSVLTFEFHPGKSIETYLAKKTL